MEIVCTHWGRALVAAAALAVVTPHAGHALTLAPHRAVYELTRHRDSTDAQVVSVSGALEVTFEAACGGWRLEQHLGFRFYGPEGNMVEHLATFSAFESSESDQFWFRTLSFHDRELDEEVSGVARPRATTPGEVRFSMPEEAVRPLDAHVGSKEMAAG